MSFASSVGGTVFSVAFRNLNATVGYARVILYGPNWLISAQIQMVDENHFLCHDASPGDHEFGMRYRRVCQPMGINHCRH